VAQRRLTDENLVEIKTPNFEILTLRGDLDWKKQSKKLKAKTSARDGWANLIIKPFFSSWGLAKLRISESLRM
jgi:hypothetical protein